MDTNEIKVKINEFIENVKNLLDNSTKETLFIQYSLDDKGYVWVSRDLVPAFEDAIKDKFSLNKYEGQKPIDKVIGQKDYSSSDLVEYAYIPIYDLPFEDLHSDTITGDPEYIYMDKFYILFEQYDRVIKDDDESNTIFEEISKL